MTQMAEQFLGSVWIDLRDEQVDEGDALSRDIDVAGIPTRHLGRYKIGSRYATHGTKMATVLVTFNSGESGMGRAKVGQAGYMDVYKRVKAPHTKS
jgi:hypothetical protein